MQKAQSQEDQAGLDRAVLLVVGFAASRPMRGGPRKNIVRIQGDQHSWNLLASGPIRFSAGRERDRPGSRDWGRPAFRPWCRSPQDFDVGEGRQGTAPAPDNLPVLDEKDSVKWAVVFATHRLERRQLGVLAHLDGVFRPHSEETSESLVVGDGVAADRH